MRLRKSFAMMLVLAMMISCIEVSAFAIEDLPNENNSFITVRAMGKFDIEVPGNTAVKADSSFPLEVGEVVTIKAVYSPFSASVDIGLLAPDGLFYGLSANNGSFDEQIEVNQRGNYTLVIRNNSDEEISVTGFVNY